jgi:hypothetical protein
LALAGLLLSILGIVIGVFATRDNGSPVTNTAARTTSAAATTSATQPIFEPPANSTCAGLRATRALQGSPGQLAGGSDLLLVKVLPHGRYERAVRVSAGDTVSFSMQLSNTAYGGINNVAVAAPLRRMTGGCWRVVVDVHSSSPSIHSYPAYLVPPSGTNSRLVIVRGSTIFYDGTRRVATLNDTIAASHADVPYTLDGGTTYFVNFDVRIK